MTAEKLHESMMAELRAEPLDTQLAVATAVLTSVLSEAALSDPTKLKAALAKLHEILRP